MKKLFFSLVALMAATMSYAQNTLVATLTHGDNITFFNGSNALVDANNAAESGDIITLSGGTFDGIVVTKGLTIRGTGIDCPNPTKIASVQINIPEGDTCRFAMEGIYLVEKIITGNRKYLVLQQAPINPFFIKCNIYRVDIESSFEIDNTQFVNCRIGGTVRNYGQGTLVFLHSIITGYNANSSDNLGNTMFINCIVSGSDQTGYRKCTFINSIVCCTTYANYSHSLPSGTVAMNSLPVPANLFSDIQSDCKINCYGNASYAMVFSNYNGSYVDGQEYELTDAAKSTYLGLDGTEIGLYGGEYPYTSEPSYPRITNLNVAKQSTADNKLSVEIEVSAAE